MSIDDVPRLIELARIEGLEPRIVDMADFAGQSRMALFRHTSSGIDVDVSLGFLPFEVEAVERGQLHQAGTLQVRIPTPEDLIILKAVAHRPKDMLDIEAVIMTQSSLDVGRIAFWVRQFADLLEMPELWTDLEKLLPKTQL